MSRQSLDIYAERARVLSDPLLASARYPSQREGERRAILDIAHKLDLRPTDRLLDIGSGIGNLTIPLSYLVGRVTASDSSECLRRLDERAPNRVLRCPGNFLDTHFSLSYDAILCYAVLHYLSDAAEVLRFVEKAIALLAPGGRALFGDLPNVDTKRRFAESSNHAEFKAWWAAHGREGTEAEAVLTHPPDTQLVIFDDALVLEMVRVIRSRGCQAFILDQSHDLPFGFTREDVLVKRP